MKYNSPEEIEHEISRWKNAGVILTVAEVITNRKMAQEVLERCGQTVEIEIRQPEILHGAAQFEDVAANVK